MGFWYHTAIFPSKYSVADLHLRSRSFITHCHKSACVHVNYYKYYCCIIPLLWQQTSNWIQELDIKHYCVLYLVTLRECLCLYRCTKKGLEGWNKPNVAHFSINIGYTRNDKINIDFNLTGIKSTLTYWSFASSTNIFKFTINPTWGKADILLDHSPTT